MDPTESPTELPPAPSATPDEAEPLGAGIDFADPNSPLARYYLRMGPLVALALLCVFLLYARIHPLTGEIWGALNRGRWVVEHGRFPDHTSFSTFSDPDTTILTNNWLAQSLFFVVYQFGARLNDGTPVDRLEGGAELLHTLHVVLVLGFCLLALLAYRRRSGSLGLACLGLFLLGVVAPPLISELRTGLLGVLCFLGLLAVLASPRLSWRSVVGVPLLMVLWANLDVSFVFGLLLLVIFAAGHGFDLLRRPGGWRKLFRDRRMLSLLGSFAASAALIAVANPQGPKLYPLLLRWANNPNLDALFAWQSMDFSKWKILHATFLGSLVLLTLATALSNRSFTATDMLLLATFSLLALFKQGVVVWWFVLVPWLLLPQLARLGETWPGLVGRRTPDFRKTIVAVILLIPLLLMLLPTQLLFRGRLTPLSTSLAPTVPWPVAVQLLSRPGPSAAWMPALARRLRTSYPQKQFVGTIYADEGASDFFLFTLDGRWPVFADGEPTHFSRRHWDDYVSLRTAGPGWWELLDRFCVNLVVVNPTQDQKLAEAIRADPVWEILPAEVGQPGRGGLTLPLLVAIRKNPLPAIPAPTGP